MVSIQYIVIKAIYKSNRRAPVEEESRGEEKSSGWQKMEQTGDSGEGGVDGGGKRETSINPVGEMESGWPQELLF